MHITLNKIVLFGLMCPTNYTSELDEDVNTKPPVLHLLIWTEAA